MLEYFDDEEWLRRQQEQSLGTVGPEATPEIPQADSAASERAKILASMPELTALPARVDLTAARQSDAESGFQRGVERASKTLTRALAGVPRDVRDEDLVSQPGQAEAMALRDESRGRDDVMAQRQAQLQERQKVLGALLRPSPTAKVKTPEELAAQKTASDAKMMNAETYAKRTSNDDENTKARLAADAERRRLGAIAAAKKAKDKADAAAEKARLAGEKQAKKDTEGLASGFELSADSNSDKKQREDHAKLVKSSKTIKGMTQKMRQMLQGADVVDRLNPVGKKRNDIKQLATMLQIEAKNVAELGALSGPDFALMQAIAADPTSLQSLTKDQSSVLDQLDAWSENSARAAAENIGAKAKSQPADSSENAKALAWANANPNDPRAAAIKAKLEVK